MYKSKDIQQQFGDAVFTYLKRKNRGGDSSQKGTRYEDYFAIYKLAQLAPAIMESGLTVDFRSQILAFVDDLIIDIEAEPIQHYQLKNSSAVSWVGNTHPLKDDFVRQEKLNRMSLARESCLILVVSDRGCVEQLAATIPSEIQEFSHVLHFPYASDSFTMVEQIPDFKDALADLSAFDNPSPDKIDYVAKTLMGVWITCQSSSGRDLLTIAQQQSPQYIRSFRSDLALDVEVAQILGNIPDFSYSLSKGFLHWNYANGLMSGTPPYSIDKDSFRRLQERIKGHKPQTFEELEILL